MAGSMKFYPMRFTRESTPHHNNWYGRVNSKFRLVTSVSAQYRHRMGSRGIPVRTRREPLLCEGSEFAKQFEAFDADE